MTGHPARAIRDEFGDETIRPPRTLVRARLVEQAGHSPLVLVTGPAGSGKSTLLEHLHESTDSASVHVTVERDHASARCLIDHLELTLRAANRNHARGLWRRAEDLVTGLETLAPFTLMLDDVHVLEDTEGGRLLDDLMADLPDGIRLVLSGRRLPAPSLARMRLERGVTHIDAEALRFRSWEVEELFRADASVPLPPEDAAVLTRRTEGWAAGVQLFRLLYQDSLATARDYIASEANHHTRHLGDYLTDVVLTRLPEELLAFLEETAPLDVLTGPVCDTLRNTTGSAEILRELTRRQLFTTELPDHPGTFRYHSVLRTELEVRASRSVGPDEQRARHRRAARTLEEFGYLPESACAFARAGDWIDVARLAGRDGGQQEIVALVDLIPYAVAREDAHLLWGLARREVRQGRLRPALELFDAAAEQLETVSASTADRCRQERIAVAAWITDHDISPHHWLAWARRLTRTRLVDASSGSTLVRALALLLDGDGAAAAELARPIAHDGRAEPPQRLVAELVATGAVAVDLDHLASPELADDLRALGHRCWELGYESLARIVWSAVSVVDVDDALEHARAILDAARRAEDPWAEAIALLNLGRGYRLRKLADDAGHLAASASAFAALHAPVLADIARRLDGGSDGSPAVGPVAARPLAGPPLRIRCFDRFECDRAGRPSDFGAGRPQVRLLLRMLAMNGRRAVHREVLAEAIWPVLDPDRARSRLHVAVSELRSLLDVDPAVERVDDSYRLAPITTWIDTVAFAAADERAKASRAAGDRGATVEALAEMVKLHRGPLLVEDGPSGWAVSMRDVFQRAAGDAALELARDQLRAGELEAACARAEEGIVIDRYRDDLWQELLTAHERAGNVVAAAEVRARYDVVLDELGLTSADDRASYSLT